ncbi:MAG: hypothetical protein WA738_00570 [Candidatus Angelobacter sp.]
MGNQNGSVYGLTILSPILQDEKAATSHNCAIREYLAGLPNDERSPFARVSSTHMARLVVMDDVVFVGHPSHEEHLKSQYLIFETNFDGDLDDYLKSLAAKVPDELHAVWQHCSGYPGVKNVDAFVTYMKRCQVTTTFFFADVNNKTVQQTLGALQAQAAVAQFIENNQGLQAAVLQKNFAEFLKKLGSAPAPVAGRPERGGPPRLHTEMRWAAREERPEQAKGAGTK